VRLNVFLFVIVPFIFLSVSGCEGDSAEKRINSAKNYLEKNEVKSAQIQLKNALQINPSLAEARFLLGKSYLKTGDLDNAIIELDKAAELGFSADEIVPLSAAAYFFKGRIDSVIEKYAELELKSPNNNSNLKVTLADSYAIKGRYVEAKKIIDDAIRNDPGNIEAKISSLRLHASESNVEETIKLINNLVEKNAKNSAAHQFKGEMLLIAGRENSEALAAFKAALEADESNLPARSQVISLLIQNKEHALARKEIEILAGKYKNSFYSLYFSALLDLEEGLLRNAQEKGLKLLSMYPDNARALHLVAIIDFKNGMYGQAITKLGKALQLFPDSVPMRLLLARSYLQVGNASKVLDVIAPLQNLKVSSADYYALAGEAKLLLGKPKEAQQLFLKAVDLNPVDVRARTFLAIGQLKGGDSERGILELKGISESDTGISSELALLSAFVSNGEFERAKDVTRSIERKQPNTPIAAVLRGRIELMQRNTENATTEFERALKVSPSYTPAALELANIDVSKGRTDLAVERLEKILKFDPSNVQAQMAIIGFKAKNGVNGAQLLELIRQAIVTHPKESLPRLAEVDALLQAGEMKLALAAATSAAIDFPEAPEFLDYQGRVYSVLGDQNQASQAFNRMANLQPNSPVPFMRLVDVQVLQKDLKGAVVNARKALAIQRDYLPAQIVLIRLLTGNGSAEEALKVARDVQSTRPTEPIGWALEGDVLKSMKRWNLSVEAYRVSLQKGPNSEAAIGLHRAYVGWAKLKEASDFSRIWLDKHPKDSEFLLTLGGDALLQSNYKEAEDIYLQALAYHPNNVVALNNLAWLRVRGGRPDAIEYAERASKLAPDSAASLDTLAAAHAATGSFEKALEIQKMAIALDPSHSEHRLNLAKYYVATGRKSEAKIELKLLEGLGVKFAYQNEVKKLLSDI
jgi:putative PEP-CTERM system TPR-repeat lipoprotein